MERASRTPTTDDEIARDLRNGLLVVMVIFGVPITALFLWACWTLLSRGGV